MIYKILLSRYGSKYLLDGYFLRTLVKRAATSTLACGLSGKVLASFCCCFLILAGCSTVPTAGPTASQIVDQASKKGQMAFALVEVDPHVIAALSNEPDYDAIPPALSSAEATPSPSVAGIGDTISVTIWDSSSGTLFGSGADSPTAAAVRTGPRSISIPDQIVAADGAISIPYAGRIPVANHTLFEIQEVLQQRLAKISVDPQVIVTINKSVSQNVTVSGETSTGMRVPLEPGGERLLDVIAAAGGTKSAPYETMVRLSRDGVTASIPMERLISDPTVNIYVMPRDTITLLKQPKTFTVFGATLNNTQLPFGAEDVSLAQAVAKAGGLQDSRADPEGVFLLRFEPPPVVRALGPAVSARLEGQEQQLPVVYHVNLRDMAGYFLATKFTMRNNDMVYVANSPVNDLQKLFSLISTITSPAINGFIVGRAAQR